MSEVRLVICDAHQSICADRHGSFADAAIAALSADPETIDELAAAMARFIAHGKQGFFRGFRSFMPAADDKPYDAGIVIIDLAARLVAHESTYSAPEREGWVPWHNGKHATEIDARYHISEDWEFTRDVARWREIAAERRRRRLETPPLDARVVLFGLPLLEFIARECLAGFRGRPPEAAAAESRPSPEDGALVRQIHIRWMMTPRDDLRGKTPRGVTVERHSHVDWNMDDRQQIWSQTRHCPPGLARESSAYRFGGFGTHELVMYYEMVRFLIWSSRDAVAELALEVDPTEARQRELVSTVEERLLALRDQWLDSPDPEFHGRTPRSIIENERLRIPEGMSGHEAVIDDDCPLCQMMADAPGPMFWGLDGCNMDNDFAFSFWHRTLEEWEREQQDNEAFNRRFAAEQTEKERLGVERPGDSYTDPDYAWEQSFVIGQETADPAQAAAVRLFTVGSHLAGIIVRLKEPPEERGLIDRLNRDFANLREVVPSGDAATGSSLLGPVVERFCATLDAVAAARKELGTKCTDLAERLRRFGDPADQEPDPQSDADGGTPF